MSCYYRVVKKNSRKEKKKNFSDFCVLQELFKLELRVKKTQREKKKKKMVGMKPRELG